MLKKEEMFKNEIAESCFLGVLFNKTIEYVNYYNFVDLVDFTDDSLRFLYDKFCSYYTIFLHKVMDDEVTEQQFNIYMKQNEQDFKTYESFGGFRLINKIKNMGEPKHMEAYFNNIKKASLMRELDSKGLLISKITNHPKFDILTIDQIESILQYNLSNTVTKVTKNKGVIDLTQGNRELVLGYMNTPYMGIPYKFSKLNDYFLGMNKGDVLIQFGYTNAGKSRKDIAELADLAFIQGKRVLKIDNEMSDIKSKNALITTICNDRAYGFNIGIPERNIKLAIYKDEKEKNKVLEVCDYLEERKGMIEFKLLSDFSDSVLEAEIRKNVITKKIDVVSYGTLKSMGDKQADWSALKTTVTMLKSLAEELGIFITIKAQLTMDSSKLSIFELDETNIGESKGIAQICDFAIIDKEISKKDLEKCYFFNRENNTSEALSSNFRWNGSKIIKNREGAKVVMAQAYDLDLNLWGQLRNLYKEA